ncbi:MAG: hypothetical protein NW237_14215 [Cyanobacteriota bacterium]|nr:hypothetical protein [Cyanobacteriota bacterium]
MSQFDYSAEIYERALRAWQCAPFRVELLAALSARGIALSRIAGQVGYQAGLTQQVLSERQADDELMWLIQVGILRREVDGQGITDSYRLAPLGRVLWERLQEGQEHPHPSSLRGWLRRYQNQLTRWGQWLS